MGLFYCPKFGRDAMDYAKSHEWIFNEYHKTENVITKHSYLNILKRRANNGSKKVAEFVRKIELSK